MQENPQTHDSVSRDRPGTEAGVSQIVSLSKEPGEFYRKTLIITPSPPAGGPAKGPRSQTKTS